MLHMIIVLPMTFNVHIPCIPVTIFGHGLRIPMGPCTKLCFTPPVRSGVVIAQTIPVGNKRSFGNFKFRQVPNIRRQSKITFADKYLIYAECYISLFHRQSYRTISRNIDVNNSIQKATFKTTRRVDIHLQSRLTINR